MPHRCTKCGAVYSDGNSVILTGCPACKWNKFLYVKDEDAGTETEIVEILSPEKEDWHIKEDDWDIEERMKEAKPIDSVLEDIDRALDSDDVNNKEMDPDRLDSIRILDMGSYELNLDSIMRKEEIVVAIRQDGQYAIDLPQMLQQKPEKTGKKKK
jgi:Zn-ribbon containing protein